MSVGIFSGTFDPVHEGHVQFALAAMRSCGLSRVVFMPEPEPWSFKTRVSDLYHRENMLKLATAGQPNLEVFILKDPKFTLNTTLPKLQDRFGEELAFLFGSDVFMRMSPQTWADLEKLKPFQIIVGTREGASRQELEARAESLGLRVKLLQTPHAALASRHVRAKSTDHERLVDGKVADYIRSNNLYS